MQPRCIQSVIVVGILSVLIISGIPEIAAINPPPEDLNAGPYVDKLVYTVIEDQDQQWLALQAGEIEMSTGFISPEHVPTFEELDIDVFSARRNGYGQITINCRDYPLNISGLRRAFAFAFDKTAVTVDVMDGFSQEHDSLVPLPNSWCAEEIFDWHYYTDQSDIGNQILDNLGFEINETTGFRHAPNGEPFNIVIEYASGPVMLTSIEYETPYDIAVGITQIGVEALQSLHIDAEMNQLGQYEIGKLYSHDDYDMIFYSTNFDDYDVDWLAYEYWSENADVEYQNPSNFANDTFDSWRDQLLYSTTYEDIYEAAVEMQKILHYNVPRLVVLENTYMQAYRNDQFTGHVEDLGRYISGPWTMRKIQKLDRTYGGTVPIAIDIEPCTFNIYHPNSTYSIPILENLYSSLYKRAPNLQPWPDLAKDILIETHSNNPAVPDGHTRFTIDIIENATWSDGTPLTATDVSFTYIYQFESALFGNPAGADIGDLIAVFAPTSYRVVLEFNTESYWHFSNFAYDYIIPEHIFNNDDGIGFENWESWNPVFDPSHPHVTCGPFLVSDYEKREFCELTYNPSFHYKPTPGPISLHPFISEVADITYELGSVGNEIIWEVSGNDLSSYKIELNDNERESGQIIDTTIRHNIDGLEVGNYRFTLTVTNYLGYSSSKTVRVTVMQTAPLIILTTSISLISAVVILAATIPIYKKKRTIESL